MSIPFPRCDISDFNQIIGMTVEEAKRSLTGMTVRETVKDGTHLNVTMDLRGNRLNVATIDGKITEIIKIG